MEGGDGINLSNWGGGGGGGMCDTVFPSIYKFCMTNTGERKAPFLGGHGNGSFPPRGEYGMSSSLYSFEYSRGQQYVNLRDEYKLPYFNIMPPHHQYGVAPDTAPPPPPPLHTAQFLHQRESSHEEIMVRAEPATVETNNDPLKKRSTPKSEKAPKTTKKPKKIPNATKEGGSGSAQRPKSAKKTTEVVINGIDMDISSIPIPVCSCTGSPQQCYRWGYGGWQSACCTTGMSMYPLPMSTKRRGARIAGRKMSLGAFKKVLEKLAAEGYNFSNPIDLRTHWAKHGTNKFVTIR